MKSMKEIANSAKIKQLLAKISRNVQESEDTEGPVTVGCPDCKDTGVLWYKKLKNGVVAQYVKHCAACVRGMAVLSSYARAEAEMVKTVDNSEDPWRKPNRRLRQED